VRAVLPTVLVVVFLICSISPVGAQISTTQAPAAPRASAPQGPAAPRSNNPFLGGVPTGELTRDALSLSITDVINRALAYNLGVLLAQNGVNHAHGTRQRVLSEMLPNITGRVSESRQVVNLAAFGFPLPAGIPSIVGPFNLFDARVYLSQSVLDFKAMNDAKAETHNIAAAQYDYKTARDLVVLVATVSYAQALTASARVDATEGQVDTSQALLNQASDLKANGLVAGIEVLRAEVQLDTDRQRVTAAKNEFEKSKLQLARLIGLPIGQTFALANQLTQVAIPDMTLEAALDRAYKTRPDYLAALQRVLAAEAKRQAASGEMKPAIRVTANFGDLGLSIADSHSTYAVTGAVEVPIFQGNRARGRLLEADAELRDRRADADDLKAGIYYEVRTAMLDLDSGNEQLEVAARARDLAATQLTQARDRFAAGVTSNIEVVQAQGAVTLANDQYISALYATSLAKGALVRAVGIAEDTARQLFGVSR
jgi:outer membrane protein TolC